MNHALKTRIPDFVVEKSDRSHLTDDNIVGTLLFDALSICFPEGERFFIESVRAFRDKITNLTLQQQVKDFIRQEGQHSHQHRKYNAMLSENNYDLVPLEKRNSNSIRFYKRFLSKRSQLAITCASEHFTAFLAHRILTEKSLLEALDPEYAKLWRWHCVEEIEHKAVCFDVYQHIGGKYLERISCMVLETVRILYLVHAQLFALLKQEKKLWRLKIWRDCFNILWGREGTFRKIIPEYLTYYKPSFHPWDEDNYALIANK